MIWERPDFRMSEITLGTGLYGPYRRDPKLTPSL